MRDSIAQSAKGKAFKYAMRYALCALPSFFLAGCAAWIPPRSAAPPPALPEKYAHYYDYPAPSLAAETISEENKDDYILRRVEFPLTLPAGLEVKSSAEFKTHVAELEKTDKKTARDLKLRFTNRIDYYVPKNLKPGEKRPAILISPILGGNMVVDHFAKYYAGRGFVAAIVHRKRTMWEDDEGIEQTENYLRTAVIRLREAVDWLSAQPEVDPEKIGAFGISYGAILHSVLAAVEPRVKYHVLAMPAAPLPEVIRYCPDKAITKMMKGARKKYGWTDEKIEAELRKVLATDPIYLAPYIPRGRVEVYIALLDRVVGVKRSFRLWRAMKKPRLRLLPFGHYGGIMVLPYLQTQSYLSLKKNSQKGSDPF